MGNRIKCLKIHLGESVQIAFAQLKVIQCTLGPILPEMEQNEERQKGLEKNRRRMSTPQNKDARRKRKAKPESKEATRKRMATKENKDADRKRKAEKIRIESRAQRKIRLENKRKSYQLAQQRKIFFLDLRHGVIL